MSTVYPQISDASISNAVPVLSLVRRCKLPPNAHSLPRRTLCLCPQDVRPTIPESVHPDLAALMRECWDKDPDKRPDFSNIVKRLEALQEAEGGASKPGEAEGKGDAQGCSCAIL